MYILTNQCSDIAAQRYLEQGKKAQGTRNSQYILSTNKQKYYVNRKYVQKIIISF